MSMQVEAQKKVLQEIMDLMDQNDLGALKSKSPKMMAIQVETKKPLDTASMMDEVKKGLLDPDHDGDDDSHEVMSHDSDHTEHEDDEDRLRELYAKLK